MPGFAREHLKPLIGSAGLHLLLLVVLAGAALRWTSSQPPVPLAIEGVVIDARDLPKSVRSGRAIPEPKPVTVTREPPPTPAPLPEKSSAEREAAAEAEQAKARAERERVAAQQARDKAAAEERRASEARRRQQEAEDAKRRAAETERRKAEQAEAARRKDAEAKAAQEDKVRAEREADLRRQLAAEEEGAAVARSGVMDEYRALLVQTIERNWRRPPSARAGLECTLFVTQATGGTVVDVRLGACNGDEAVRESITNAVYRASPLPAPRDPRAFQRRLEIVFKPTE
jgi:colicin import membrane protein